MSTQRHLDNGRPKNVLCLLFLELNILIFKRAQTTKFTWEYMPISHSIYLYLENKIYASAYLFILVVDSNFFIDLNT